MYRLLLVDDEPLVLIGLESMLPWSEYNITICGSAANGKQALEMIETMKPDIVIADIMMPIMNGLELLEECHKRLPDPPEFIILTCYEEFPYVKTALKYQAVDYIIKLGLKPDELATAIEHAIKLRQQKHPQVESESQPLEQLSLEQYKNKFILKLLHNLFESEEQFSLQAKQLQLTFDANCYTVASCQIVTSQNLEINDNYMTFYHRILSMVSNLLSKSATFHLIALDMKHFCILFALEGASPYSDPHELYELLDETFQTIDNYFNVQIFCGVGDYKHNIHLVSESHQEARQIVSSCTDGNPLLLYHLQHEDDQVASLNNIFQVTVLKEDLHKAFNEFDTSAFRHIIESVTDLFHAHPNKYVQAMDLTSKILHFCLTNMPDSESYLRSKFSGYRDSYCSLYSQNSTEKILKWLELFNQAILEFYDKQYKDFKNELVQNIIQYVDEHLSEKLILNDVAAIFSISPNYLGHLFKKNTSLGFNEYVTKAKISKAKYLLFNSDLKLYEISALLGYENYFYFSRVFKKVEGCSPSQYIQKQLPPN